MCSSRPLPPLLQEILVKRGIPLTEQANFLQPDYKRDLFSPERLKDLKSALSRLVLAIEQKEVIGIFGDYDADGIPATALIVRALRRLGVEAKPLIPTRAAGYGLTGATVEKILKAEIKLLITVDNGTVSKEEIARLRAGGVEAIICDHHQPQAEHLATDASAIINPKQTDCPYPFKELCGTALAWKLMQALYRRLGKDPEVLKWELDLVALATVADMVPLLGENRALVHFGLKVLAKSRNLGLRALAEVAGVDLSSVTAGAIGFRLAPRLNAPSRMHQELEGEEHIALRLLITDALTEATRLAATLNQQNLERQELVESHLREALVQADTVAAQALCLVVYAPEWSTGVIGLVAGRLLERYNRPVLALAPEGGELKGSIRTVEGVSAVELLEGVADQLSRYGGHHRAGGFSLKGNSVDLLRMAVNEWLRERGWQLSQLNQQAKRKPDAEIGLKEVDAELAEAIRQLEPFGVGFPSPLFASRVLVRWPRRVGAESQHLACVLEDEDGERRKGIAFRFKNDFLPKDGEFYRVLYTLTTERWNGQESVVAQIQSIESVE